MADAVIMFNGPPRAGKDTATAATLAALPVHARVIKVTEPIKDEAHRRFGLDCAHDAYDHPSVKDSPLAEFGGLTPREAYIATSRSLKAEFGEDVVCRMLVERLRQACEPLVVVPDVGDDMEAGWLAREVGAARTLLVRVHMDGKDFSRDCRTWVRLPPDVEQHDIRNVPGRRSEFERAVACVVATFAGRACPAPALAR